MKMTKLFSKRDDEREQPASSDATPAPSTEATKKTPLDAAGLDLLFRAARTYGAWQDKPVLPETIEALYALVRWGPTSANSCPTRFVFVTSPEAKERLKPHLDPGNVDKTMSAPCCAIIAYDKQFYDVMAKLMPMAAERAKEYFGANAQMAETSAFRNSSLQGGYFIMAARALGLDCGPMQGFNRESLDKEFFPDGRWTANFLINIGYGDDSKLWPRMPRLDFDEACRVL